MAGGWYQQKTNLKFDGLCTDDFFPNLGRKHTYFFRGQILQLVSGRVSTSDSQATQPYPPTYPIEPRKKKGSLLPTISVVYIGTLVVAYYDPQIRG